MRSLVFGLLFLWAPPLNAQPAEPPKTISFEGKNWQIAAQSARTDMHLGREALILSGGRIWLKSLEFSDGVIEFDVSFDERQGFIGPMWRAKNDQRFEEIYFRSHLSGKPDAVQYTPVENGNSAWQIFSDGNALAAIDLKFDGWNRVKVVVEGDAADFYFNSGTPQLHIPDLKTDIQSGYVGLRSSGRGGAEARFSNITFRALKNGEGVVGTPKETPPLPKGLIDQWRVSSVFAEADVSDALTLSNVAANDMEWKRLRVETNGIANISKLRKRLPDGDSTVFIRKTIRSERNQMKELFFGYSDRVRIYLNGKRVYYGDAGFRRRDYRFLGTVGFFDSVGLDLTKGENELLVAVSETFGGWAWAGAMEDQSGISIRE